MYISIDIETGGLNKDMDILQVACVAWDRPKIEECSFIDFIINQDDLLVEPFAANLNRNLIALMAEGKDQRLVDGYEEAWQLLGAWLDGFGKSFAIGKNASMFDLPFLEAHGFPVMDHFKHRVLDAGVLYATRDGIPSLSEIVTKLEKPPFAGQLHDALYDARLTLWVVQKALGNHKGA